MSELAVREMVNRATTVHGAIADAICPDGNAGRMVCRNGCESVIDLEPTDVAGYLRNGWPRCCGREMRWEQKTMTDQSLIYCHPHVRNGAPCIVGTRITIREIQRDMKESLSMSAVAKHFEGCITRDEVQAALNHDLADVHHSWRGGGVDILEGEDVMYIGHGGTSKIPLDEVPTAIAAMQAAYAEWQALGQQDDE